MKKIISTFILCVVLSACTKPLGDVQLVDNPSLPPESFSISLKQLVDDKLMLSWGKSLNAKSYTLKYGTTAGNYSHTLENVVSPVSLATLTHGQIYYFKVFSRNDIGENSTAEDSITFHKKPGDFDFVDIDTQLGITKVRWTASTNATNYIVKIGTTSGSYSVPVPVAAPNTEVDIPGLTPSQVYYFRIVASNSAGNKNSATEFTHGPEAPPSAPANFLATVDPSDRYNCKLTWTDASGAGAKTYTVQKATTGGATPPGGATTVYTGSGLNVDVPITAQTFFWAKTTSVHGESTWVGPQNCADPKPTVDSLSLVPGYRKITATWTGTNADTYKVEYGTSAASITNLAGEFPNSVTSFEIPGLTNGQIYHIRITAVNAHNTGNRTASATPINTAPTITRLNSQYQTSFQTPIDFKVSIADAEDTLDCTAVTVFSSNNNLVVNPSSATVSGTSDLCVVRLTPEAGSEGQVSIVLRVTDLDGTFTSLATVYVQVYPAAERIYSFRRKVATYNGPAVKIRRNNDGATQDFAYLDSSDALNTAGISTFISGAGGATVATWYDQSGHGRHATQADASKQFTYISTYFEGNGDRYFEAPALNVTSKISGIFSASSRPNLAPAVSLAPFFSWSDHTGDNGIAMYSYDNPSWHFQFYTGNTPWQVTDWQSFTPSTTIYKYGFSLNGSSGSLVTKYSTGALQTQNGIAFSAAAGSPLLIGAGSSDVTADKFKGRMSDFVIFSQELSTTQMNMINSF